MKVFLTGASGALGRMALNVLLARGHRLTLLCRPRSGELARHRSSIAGNGLIRVPGDLLDTDRWGAALEGQEVVLHLAGVTHASRRGDYFRVNTRGTHLLAVEAARRGVRRLVYVSTRAVGAACGAYGESKLEAEDLIKSSGLEWVILRPAEVYGTAGGYRRTDSVLSSAPDEKPLDSLAEEEAVVRAIKTALTRKIVLVPGLGESFLAPVHAEDVCQALAAACERPGVAGRTYTLAGPRVVTYRALMRLACRAHERRPPMILPVPLFLLRFAAWLFAVTRIRHPPLVPDQIPRLACAKAADIGAAGRDLGFEPRDLETWLVGMEATPDWPGRVPTDLS